MKRPNDRTSQLLNTHHLPVLTFTTNRIGTCPTIGGGLIIVPGLVGFAHMERRLAHGTSLAATLPIAAASLITYVSHGNVDWAVVRRLVSEAAADLVVGR